MVPSAVLLLPLLIGMLAVDLRAATVIEGFEGVKPSINSPIPPWGPDTDYLTPGANSPYRFSSGVQLVAPIPNGEATAQGTGALLVDFSQNNGNGFFGLEFNGSVTSPSQLPGGTAFLGWDNTASSGSIRFAFAAAQTTVGAFVDAASGNIVETAYDAQGHILGTASVASGDVSIWPNNFLAISLPGIRSVSFNGDFEVIDNLTFTSPVTVSPEPGSEPLVVLGLAAAAAAALRRRS